MGISQSKVIGVGMLVVLLSSTACGALVTTAPRPVGTGSTTIVQPYLTPQHATPIYAASLAAVTPGWSVGPTCTFAHGGLTVQPDGGQAYICLAPMVTVGDFSAAVTVQPLTGSPTHAFGIAFRHAAPKNYDFFGIDGRGRFTLTIVINDVSQTIIPFTYTAVIHTGTVMSNSLQVIMQGQTATLFVNDHPVGQATLTAFVRGTVGLRGVNDGTVVFTQLTVTAV